MEWLVNEREHNARTRSACYDLAWQVECAALSLIAIALRSRVRYMQDPTLHYIYVSHHESLLSI